MNASITIAVEGLRSFMATSETHQPEIAIIRKGSLDLPAGSMISRMVFCVKRGKV
jgi:hypothetical protein